MAAGIAEFVFGTVAVYLAWQRTRSQESPVTRAVRWTGRTMVIAYPLLGVAYLTDRFGAFVEPIFFTCFSVMVLTELVETVRTSHVEPSADHARRAWCGSPARCCSGCPGADAIHRGGAATGRVTPGGRTGGLRGRTPPRGPRRSSAR